MSDSDTIVGNDPVVTEATHTPNGSIKLGSRVRDVFTGWEGIAMCRERRLEGAVLILVEKTLDPDSDSMFRLKDQVNFFDECRLTVINEDLCKHTNPLDQCDVPLGVAVEEVIHNLKGIVTRIIEQLNGCVHLFVEYSEMNKEKGTPDRIHFHEDHKRFKVIGKGVATDEALAATGYFQDDPQEMTGDMEVRSTVASSPTGCCIDGLYR